jgi:hypothetical protein
MQSFWRLTIATMCLSGSMLGGANILVVDSARAEPQCPVARDSGTATRHSHSYSVGFYATWTNCGGGTATDRVKLNVSGGSDSSCYSVQYGSTFSTDYHPSVKWAITSARWERC